MSTTGTLREQSSSLFSQMLNGEFTMTFKSWTIEGGVVIYINNFKNYFFGGEYAPF